MVVGWAITHAHPRGYGGVCGTPEPCGAHRSMGASRGTSDSAPIARNHSPPGRSSCSVNVMQPRDLFRRRRPGGDAAPPPEPTPADESDEEVDHLDVAPVSTPSTAERPDSIRDRQKRRRDAARQRLDISAFLGTSAAVADPELDADLDAVDDDDDDDDDEDGPTPAPVTGQVWIVFRSVSWTDAEATLRESDTLVSVFSTEAAAKLAVVSLDRDAGGEAEHWYQPYKVAE